MAIENPQLEIAILDLRSKIADKEWHTARLNSITASGEFPTDAFLKELDMIDSKISRCFFDCEDIRRGIR